MEYFRQRYIDELNSDEPVRVQRFEWPPADVLQFMAPHDFEALFVEWVGDAKQAAKERTREFLAEFGCLERFNRLYSQLKTESVIPFVGAGLSKSTGYPLWGEFLEKLTRDYVSIGKKVKKSVVAGQYEDAAQTVLDKVGEDVFDEEIQTTFGANRSVKGPVKLLPFLFRRGCITTNFDYVLNRVYDAVDKPFKGEFIGSRLMEAPRRLAAEPHCLLRLHGEADSAQGRVLTAAEYAASYGEDGAYRQLFEHLVANTSLLFLGCSLSVDRTIAALKEINAAARVAAPRHFALLPITDGPDREARRIELGTADIHPIWYPGEDHDQAIEDLLISLMDGAFCE